MKKILLIGQFTDEFRKVNKALAKKYEVRACVNKVETFRGMFKLNKPDVIAVLIEELDKTNGELLNELKTKHRKIPVICSGLKLENNAVPEKFLTKQFEFIDASEASLERIVEAIEGILEKDMDEEENVAETAGEKQEQDKTEQDQEETKKEEIKKEEKPRGEDRRKTIMLVDDSGIYLRMMKGLLEEDYDVVMTTSGLKAMAMVHEKHPDLILLDYEMPLFDGRETMVKIRESAEGKNIPIVFVTAVNDKEHIKAVLSLRPTAYLLKPIDKERLFKTLKEIFGNHKEEADA